MEQQDKHLYLVDHLLHHLGVNQLLYRSKRKHCHLAQELGANPLQVISSG